MIVIPGEWMNSKYVTIDEVGWHCSEDVPEEIKKSFEDFMESVNSDVEVIEP